MLDPIADMLTRIRNAQRAGHASVSIPASKLKLAIAEVLRSRGFIERVDKKTDDVKASLEITLRYDSDAPLHRLPIIHEIRRVSREGRRVYAKTGEIRKVKNGYGVAVISTSKGVMTGEEAHKQGLGGEYICEVW